MEKEIIDNEIINNELKNAVDCVRLMTELIESDKINLASKLDYMNRILAITNASANLVSQLDSSLDSSLDSNKK